MNQTDWQSERQQKITRKQLHKLPAHFLPTQAEFLQLL